MEPRQEQQAEGTFIVELLFEPEPGSWGEEIDWTFPESKLLRYRFVESSGEGGEWEDA